MGIIKNDSRETEAKGDVGSALDHKRYLESRSEEILDGRLSIEERGPKEFRPQLPEEMRSTFVTVNTSHHGKGCDCWWCLKHGETR